MNQILRSLETATDANRWTTVGDLGKIRFRPDTGTYFLDFRPYGRVYRHRGIPITDEDTARRLLEQIRTKVAEDRTLEEVLASYLPNEAEPNLVSVRVERWLDVKRREVEAGDRAPMYLRELKRYARSDGHFSWWEGRTIYEIDYAALEDWSLWLADRGISPKTRRNVLGGFHSFMAWLRRRGEIRELPEVPWPKAPEHQPKVLSPDAQEALLEAIPAERRGIFLAMALMGIRPGEARALDASDYREGWLSVDKAVKGPRLDSPIRGTKSGKGKRLPVPEALEEWIAEWVPPDARLQRAPLFTNPPRGVRWTPSAIRRTWETACREVGIEGISVYEGCKHSFATEAIGRGVSERLLQNYLGHADVRSTRRYALLADSALIQVLRPRRATSAGTDLSRTCPACGEPFCNCPAKQEKMVEAAGIEPASAWLPASASTCVALVQSRQCQSREREKQPPRPT